MIAEIYRRLREMPNLCPWVEEWSPLPYWRNSKQANLNHTSQNHLPGGNYQATKEVPSYFP